ncbi:MAG: hydrogenase iron-sulfur subunit, partial [Thermoplasmata archaeon]|nr:hydrogenase iron-sulfur subunit [Thermoplasmata archaeon]
IVAFCCNWCSYAGADLAGVSRVQIPSSFRIVRIMCSGRIDPELCVRLLREGLDGVLVLGCHPGDCHYIEGNYHARRKLTLLRDLMDYMGIDQKRFRISWVSASEGHKFAEVVTRFTEQVKELGPQIKLSGGEEK